MAGKLFKILVSRSDKGRETRFFPEITTTSIPGKPAYSKRRNTSRIIRLARLRITALPIFLDAMMPSRFLFKPLLRKNRVNVVSTLVLCPRFITASNCERCNNLTLLGNDWFPNESESKPFSTLTPAIGQNFTSPDRRFSRPEAMGTLSSQNFWLIRSFHDLISLKIPNPLLLK